MKDTHTVKPFPFYEGPKAPVNDSYLSSQIRSGMNTLLIDGYRQGTEIITQRHFVSGMFKIHAGEYDYENNINHVVKQNRFGMDNQTNRRDAAFTDNEKFNPVKFIQIQEKFSYIYANLITLPFYVDDNDETSVDNYDGVIEPLDIRATVALRPTEVPFLAHSIKASLTNSDDAYGAVQILQSDYFRPETSIVIYDDEGYFKNEFIRNKPFDDIKRYSQYWSADIINAQESMRGSTDDYISTKQRSSCTGRDYDNNTSVGTDSIAFGGLTY
jgi:hypothetical protein